MAAEVGEAVRLAVLLVAVMACGSPQRRPEPVTERRDCIVDAPPKAPEGVLIEACPGGDDGDFAACLSKPSAIALIGYLTALQRYARDAHAKCGPMPEE